MRSLFKTLHTGLNLERKILTSIATVTLVTVVLTIVLVNSMVQREVGQGIAKNLAHTQSIFESFQSLQAQELTLKNRLLTQIPFVKALISSKNEEAILQFAQDALEKTQSDLFIITDEQGRVLARTDTRRAGEDLSLFSPIRQAADGDEGSGILAEGASYFRIFSIPIRSGNATLGTLSMGYRIDDAYAGHIKKITGSEATFLVNGRIIASVWQNQDRSFLQKTLAAHLDGLKTRPSGSKDKGFDMKLGSEKYASLLIPIQSVGQAFVGHYLIQVSRDKAMAIFYNIRRMLIGLGALVLLIGIWVSMLIAKQISRPITMLAHVSGSISQGDLTKSVSISRSDEIGILGNAFNDMAQKLRVVISKVRDNSTALSDATKRLRLTTGSDATAISEEVHQLEQAADQTSASIVEMDTSIQEVNQSIQQLSLFAKETSRSLLGIDSGFDNISHHMDGLSSGIETISSSISEMTSGIKSNAKSLDTLNTVTTQTSGSLHQINTSVQKVEDRTQHSYVLSENTAHDAQRGMEAVKEISSNMREIQGSFADLRSIVSRLDQKSAAIDKIILVIQEVASQVDLLSLNAAIIAAQAGEQGKGFSVVAGEVKALAERTATSTQEIASLIKDLQDETAQAVGSVTIGSKKIDKGVALSHDADIVFKGIIESAHLSKDVSENIFKDTQEQAKDIQKADQAMLEIKDMVQQIQRGIHEQGAASAEISRAVEEIRNLGLESKHMTQEHEHESKKITQEVQRVSEMIEHTLSATHQLSKGVDRIKGALDIFKAATDKNVQRSSELNDIVATLASRSNQLNQEVDRFKL